ncbi:MAG: hypothetical protein AABZ55_11640 [Bdellovibrionota bacterium]
MKKRLLIALVPVLALSLVGWKPNIKLNLGNLGKKKEQPSAGAPTTSAAALAGESCNATQGISLCYVFSGAKNKEEKTKKGNQMACKLFKGSYTGNNTCPTGALGRCTILGGAPGEYTLIYYPGKFNASKAQSDCQNPKSGIHIQGAGVWVAGS